MRALAWIGLAVFLVGCSEAETPNAGFDAGAGPADAGAEAGNRDQPCFPNNTCSNATLTCVNDTDGIPKCRVSCDPNTTDCGPDQVCTGILDAGGSVCAPVP